MVEPQVVIYRKKFAYLPIICYRYKLCWLKPYYIKFTVGVSWKYNLMEIRNIKKLTYLDAIIERLCESTEKIIDI